MVAARARTRGAESSRVWLAAAITIAIATIWLQRNGECNQESGVSEFRRESLSLSLFAVDNPGFRYPEWWTSSRVLESLLGNHLAQALLALSQT